jgi:chromosome segregation ATPase
MTPDETQETWIAQAVALAEETKEIASKATPGAWVAELDMFDAEAGYVWTVCDNPVSFLVEIETNERPPDVAEWNAEAERARDAAVKRAKEHQASNDARHIAHARAAAPALADAVVRLAAEVERLRKRASAVESMRSLPELPTAMMATTETPIVRTVEDRDARAWMEYWRREAEELAARWDRDAIVKSATVSRDEAIKEGRRYRAERDQLKAKLETLAATHARLIAEILEAADELADRGASTSPNMFRAIAYRASEP